MMTQLDIRGPFNTVQLVLAWLQVHVQYCTMTRFLQIYGEGSQLLALRWDLSQLSSFSPIT